MATIGVVVAIAGSAWWWEKQLPGKLQQAAQEGDLEACLNYGEQLAALRWLGSGAPEEQALCRRRQAEILWDDGQISAALKLQTQLIESGLGNTESQQQDRDRLALWQEQLRNRALVLFRDGDLEKALETLAPLTPASSPGSSALSDTLKETWNRNRLNHEPKRPRKLLLKEREINKMFGAVERKGMTLVPLSVYFNATGRAKVELALARGKQAHDKRATIKDRDWKRDKARLMREKG